MYTENRLSYLTVTCSVLSFTSAASIIYILNERRVSDSKLITTLRTLCHSTFIAVLAEAIPQVHETFMRGTMTFGPEGLGDFLCYFHVHIYSRKDMAISNSLNNIQEDLAKINLIIVSDTTRTTQKTKPSMLHCRGNVFNELLPSNYRGILILLLLFLVG